MNLSELIRKFRVAAFDHEQPYLFSDSDITDWLNDAVDEAAIRGRLIHESVNPLVCTIAVTQGISSYPIHKALYEIESIHWVDTNRPSRTDEVMQISQEDMAIKWGDWRTRAGSPEYAIQQDTTIRIVPAPKSDGVLYMEGYRTPLEPMTLDTDTPEINPIHHKHLIQWALHEGFSIPDSEVFDADRAELSEYKFTEYFGERPSANLRRRTREDVPHHVKAWWV